MAILGPNGKDIDLSKGQVIGQDMKKYRIGDIEVASPDAPEVVLVKALEHARGFLMQQGHINAAGNVTPFQFEPCALATFMMLCNEVKRLNGEIELLKKGKDDENADDSEGV